MEHEAHLGETRFAVRRLTWSEQLDGPVTEHLAEFATREEALEFARSQPVPPVESDVHLEVVPGQWEPDDLGDGLMDATWAEYEDGWRLRVWLWPGDDGQWELEHQT